jgi:hypothetical protein
MRDPSTADITMLSTQAAAAVYRLYADKSV